MDKDQIDILKRLEEITSQLNQLFSQKSKSVLERYPITFALLVVFGISMVSEGVKGLLEMVPFFKNEPLVMLVAGLIALTITGSLYKKLEK